MVMRPILDADARGVLARYRKQLLEEADLSSKELASIMQTIERTILRTIENRRSKKISKAELARVQATINRIILEGYPTTARWLSGEIPKGQLNGLATQAAFLRNAYSVREWDELPSRRIRETFKTFEDSIRKRRVLRLTNADLRKRWMREWDIEMGNTMRSLSHKFIDAHARGISWTELVDEIKAETGELRLAGKMAPETFARGFARAKLTEAANDASIAVATQAGITKFINIGVGDSRQSTECREASAQKPMTRAEWDASPWGRPPRHVLNCRCDLAGIPEDVEDSVLA